MYSIKASPPSRGKGVLRGDCVRQVIGKNRFEGGALRFPCFDALEEQKEEAKSDLPDEEEEEEEEVEDEEEEEEVEEEEEEEEGITGTAFATVSPTEDTGYNGFIGCAGKTLPRQSSSRVKSMNTGAFTVIECCFGSSYK